ncbi:hypothetical protein Tco_0140767 [Tanacetum coccineum]
MGVCTTNITREWYFSYKDVMPVTAEEKTNKKNDVKARSLLLMALPNEHQLTFSQYNDVKTMFAAIETRFRGNEATKKTQKTLLKQQYMNKAEIETMSIDDLYNNFKIVEQKVNKSIGTSSGAQNLAFMTTPSTSSTNDVNTAKHAYEVSTISPNVNTASSQVSTASFSDNAVYAFMVENPNGSNLLQQDLEQIHEDDLEAMDLKWQLSLLSMRAKRYFQRTGKKIFINANDTAGYDKSKQGNNEDTSSKAMLAIDGVGFDWSDMAEEQVQTNMALMAFSDSEVYNDKTCSKTCLKNYETLKKQCDDLIVKLNQTEFTAATYKRGLATVEEQLVTYRKNEVLFIKEVAVLKREVASKDYEINVLKSEFEKVKQEKKGIEFKIEKFDNASKSLDKLLGSQITDKSKKGLVYNNKYQKTQAPLNVDKEIVLLVDKKIEFIKPKNHEKPVKKSFSPRAGNAARSYTAPVNVVRAKRVNAVKTSACWVWRPTRPNGASLGKPQQDDTGFIDSGCSRHMTGNIAYLSDFKEFDRGYVTFGGGAHGGRISSKGTLKTDSLDFKDVYFVNELNFNLFSVSQMCDKKNYVLFTDTESKFDGKKREGFFVGYSLSSKAFRVYNTRTRRVEENLHIRFLENKPMIEGNGPKWLFDIDSLTQSMNYVPVAAGTISNESAGTQGELNAGTSTQKEEISQDCIVMPIWKDASYFDSPSKDVGNGEPKSATDDQKQVEDGPHNESDEKDKSEDDSSPKEVNAAGQHVNTASPEVNTGHFKLNIVDPLVNIASLYDPDSPKDMFKLGTSHTLKATHVEFFNDED